MYFTQEDYKKIENWLHRNSVKDTEFQEALPFTGKEIVTVVQDGHNRKVNIQEFINQLYKHGVEDFLNVTNTYRANNITLKEAIRLIPAEARKEGQVITFLNTDGNWEIYQFIGKLNQWNTPTLWNNPFDWEKLIVDSILPDEEDLTKSAPDAKGNSYLSLKNRKYEPDKYSGLGRKILRRRVVEIEDPIYGTQEKNLLLQADFAEDNTVYVVRYDFTLNGQDITLPDNSYIEYEGGSISDGNIIDRAGGLNRVVLKKNIINGKNILTQEMINKSNTIYEIRYDFTLGEDVTIPANCILKFEGGSISGANKITSSNTLFEGNVKLSVDIDGVIGNEVIYISWFNDFSIDRTELLFANASYKIVVFDKLVNLTDYTISSTWESLFHLKSNTTIKFEGDGKIVVTPKEMPGWNGLFGTYKYENTENLVFDGLKVESSTNDYVQLATIYLAKEVFQNDEKEKHTINNVIIKNCKTNNMGNLAYIVNRMDFFSDFRPANHIKIFNNYCENTVGSFVTSDGKDIEIYGNYVTIKDTSGYDAVSCHCGINIRILSNIFIGNGNNNEGMVINVRNSPETTNTSKNVTIENNYIENGIYKAIQISASIEHSELDTPSNIKVINNKIKGSVVISGLGCKNVEVSSNNIYGNIYISHTTSSFGEHYIVSKNRIENFRDGISPIYLNCILRSIISDNYIVRSTDSNVTHANNIFNFVRNSSIRSNDFSNTMELQNPYATTISDNRAPTYIFPSLSKSNCEVCNNWADGYITYGDITNTIIDFTVGISGRITINSTWVSTPPSVGSWNAGDKIYYPVPTSTSMGCVCTKSGTPGTWKEINIS